MKIMIYLNDCVDQGRKDARAKERVYVSDKRQNEEHR